MDKNNEQNNLNMKNSGGYQGSPRGSGNNSGGPDGTPNAPRFDRIIIYIVISGIDKFVYHIPNVIYIPVAILGIAMILIGFFKGKSK